MPLDPELAAKYLRPSAPQKMKARTLIERADEIPMSEIVSDFGVRLPDQLGASWKAQCPFSYEHADGGLDPNCRYYPSNTVHCFAMHGTMRPTQVYARRIGVSRRKAAVLMLEERGLLRPLSYQDVWREGLERRADDHEDLGQAHDMVASLQKALRGVEGYAEQELEPAVQEEWSRVLASLDEVMSSPDSTIDDLRNWLSASVEKIVNTLTSDNVERKVKQPEGQGENDGRPRELGG